MYISYAQLGAIHDAAGQIEINARRGGQKLHAGLFVGSVKSTDIDRVEGSDDIVAVFDRYEAPAIVRRFSYFGNAVYDKPTVRAT